ncbi:MAG TPA: T9SS type B sorting domain-containing protein, partial [Flavobacteriia bacterium]|nr:T9SS type B sorting domain-containing protein [Flavobacteriia bacterium]
VNPTPVMATVTDQIVCNTDATTAVVFSSSVIGTTFNWTNDTPSIGLAASGTGDIASFIATNTTSTAVTATITVTPTANGCVGTDKTFIITVNPTPVMATVADQAVCNTDATTAVVFSSSVVGTTFNWTNDTPSIGLAAYGTGDIASFTAVNTGTTPVIATITVTPTVNGCVGTDKTFTITVNPPDISEFAYTSNHICITDANPFPIYPNANVVYGGTFSILTNSGTADSAAINPNTGEIDLNTVNAGTTYVITYDTAGAPTSNCPSQSSFTLTIDAEVFADFTYPNALECIDAENPLPIMGANTLLGGTFTVDPPTIDIIANTGELNLSSGVAGETYTVSYTTPNTSTCSDTKTFDVKVIGLPEFELPIQVFLCPDQSTTLIEVQNPQANYTYEWVNAEDANTVIAIGDSFEAPAVGIYAVIATEPENLCTQTKIVQVGLAEQAVIANVFVNDFNRPNNSITVVVEGGTGDYTYYLIDQDGNETAQVNNPVFENLLPSVYTVRVEDNQGCSVAIERTDLAVLDYPRFFTPNGDNYYDYWQIDNSYLIPGSKIYIFDRFGKVLAQIDPNGLGWDGLYLGKPVPATDYWFKAEYRDPNTDLPRTVKGHFSIVRKRPIN